MVPSYQFSAFQEENSLLKPSRFPTSIVFFFSLFKPCFALIRKDQIPSPNNDISLENRTSSYLLMSGIDFSMSCHPLLERESL